MDGRVVVITGGFGALGRVVAEVAAKRGASVTALGRSAPPNDLAGRLGPSALLLDGVDLTDAKSCTEVFARVSARSGRLDALINVVRWSGLGIESDDALRVAHLLNNVGVFRALTV